MAMNSSKTEQAELIQDLPADFVADILISLEEVEAGNVLEYQMRYTYETRRQGSEAQKQTGETTKKATVKTR